MSMVTVPPRVPLLEAPCVEDMSRARRRRLRARRVAVRQSLLHTAKLKNLLNDITEPFVWEHSLSGQAPPGNPLWAGSYFQTCTPVEVLKSAALVGELETQFRVSTSRPLSAQAEVFAPGPSLSVLPVVLSCETTGRRACRDTQAAERLPSRPTMVCEQGASVAESVDAPESVLAADDPGEEAAVQDRVSTRSEEAAGRASDSEDVPDLEFVNEMLARMKDIQGGNERHTVPGTSAGVTRYRAAMAVYRLNSFEEPYKEMVSVWVDLPVEIRRLALGELNVTARQQLLRELRQQGLTIDGTPTEAASIDLAGLAAEVWATPMSQRQKRLAGLTTAQKSALLAYMSKDHSRNQPQSTTASSSKRFQ